jgi:hypothetical protein
VVVVTEETEGAETCARWQVKPLGAGEKSQDDLLEIGMRAKQKAPVLSASRYLDKGATGRNEAEACHPHIEDGKPGVNLTIRKGRWRDRE